MRRRLVKNGQQGAMNPFDGNGLRQADMTMLVDHGLYSLFHGISSIHPTGQCQYREFPVATSPGTA
jgi:hypothetical protein